MNVCPHEAFIISSLNFFQYAYSNAERILAATDLTSLLANLESMTSKPTAGGGNKNYVAWKIEKAVNYFVNADKVTMDSSTN